MTTNLSRKLPGHVLYEGQLWKVDAAGIPFDAPGPGKKLPIQFDLSRQAADGSMRFAYKIENAQVPDSMVVVCHTGSREEGKRCYAEVSGVLARQIRIGDQVAFQKKCCPTETFIGNVEGVSKFSDLESYQYEVTENFTASEELSFDFSGVKSVYTPKVRESKRFSDCVAVGMYFSEELCNRFLESQRLKTEILDLEKKKADLWKEDRPVHSDLNKLAGDLKDWGGSCTYDQIFNIAVKYIPTYKKWAELDKKITACEAELASKRYELAKLEASHD